MALEAHRGAAGAGMARRAEESAQLAQGWRGGRRGIMGARTTVFKGGHARAHGTDLKRKGGARRWKGVQGFGGPKRG